MNYFERSIPVASVAHLYGKDPSWVRAGLISGWLPFGFATRHGEKVTDISKMGLKYGRINYYISPKLFYEETGLVWKGGNHFEYVNPSGSI